MWIVWLFYFVLHLFISRSLWLGSEEQVWLSSSSPWSLQMDLESITLVSCCGWSNRLQNCPMRRWSLSSLSLLRLGSGVILSLRVRLTFWMGRGNEVGPCILGGSWGGLNLIFWDDWFKDNVGTLAGREVTLCPLVSWWAELGDGESGPKWSINT